MPVILKAACLVLAAALVAGAWRLAADRRSLDDDGGILPVAPGVASGPAGDAGGPAKAEGKKADGPPGPPAIPPRYRVIGRSRIFGTPPGKQAPQPTLVGIAGDRAFIQLPSGRLEILPEGGEAEGLKVLRIDMNRALVEYKGKQVELTLFSGMGSSPLLPQEEGRRP
jgi:hypothetical protein